jgi:mannose-6-phosphate isomerase class I
VSCLARSEAFTAWRLTATNDAPVTRNTEDRVRTLHVIEGAAQIDSAGGALRLKRGQSALLPARLGAWTLSGDAVAVEAAPGVVL